MDERTLAAAAAEVVSARLERRPLRKLEGVASLEDGYAVQQRANAMLEVHLGRRAGHKIGGTTEAMRRYINVPEPLAGEVFASRCYASGATVGRGDCLRLGIETEIAVRLATDLPPRPEPYRRADVSTAVASVYAAIELVDDRYDEFAKIGGPTQIADNAFNAGSVLGDPVTAWQHLDLAGLSASTLLDDRVLATGRSDALLGHPLDALAWIATKRSQLGLGLMADSFVTLGSITPVAWVTGPGVYGIEVEELGTVSVKVS